MRLVIILFSKPYCRPTKPFKVAKSVRVQNYIWILGEAVDKTANKVKKKSSRFHTTWMP